MSDAQTIFDQQYAAQKEVVYSNLRNTQRADELSATVQFLHFKGEFDKTSRKYVGQDVCPMSKKTKPRESADGTSSGKSYNQRIPVVTRLLELNIVDGVSSTDQHGNYSVTAEVKYIDEPDSGPCFSDWAMEFKDSIYDDEDATLDPATKRAMRNYVAPTGEVVSSTKVILQRDSQITIKCPDEGSKSIFRQRFEGTDLNMVQPNMTKLMASKVNVEVWLWFSKQGETYVPRYSTSMVAGYIKLAPGEENYKGMARRMREGEDPDAHNMAYAPDVKDHKIQVPRTAYFRVQERYTTPVPPPNAEGRGVHVRVKEHTSHDDFIYTDKDQEQSKRFTKEFTVMQWKNTPVDGMDSYGVKLQTGGQKSEEVANSFGFLDTQEYAQIMFAHWDVTFHVTANLYWKGTFDNRPDNSREKMEAEQLRLQKLGQQAPKGYYNYYAEKVAPDYRVYFEECAGAIQISKTKCADLFEDYLGTRRKTGEQQLVLRSTMAVNPVNRDGASAEVILLGRPDHNVYNGDVWPFITNGRVYVMTSYSLSSEERSTICGPNADLNKADARFEEIKETPGFYYMVFVVKDTNPQEDQEQEQEAPKTIKETKKKKKKEKNAPLEVEEQEENSVSGKKRKAPTTKKKTTKRTPPKKKTKKKPPKEEEEEEPEEEEEEQEDEPEEVEDLDEMMMELEEEEEEQE